MQLDCIVLSGGLGTRLQSVVSEKPKCLGISKWFSIFKQIKIMKEILKEIIGFTIFTAFCVYGIYLISYNTTLRSNKPLTPTIQLKIKDNKVDTLYIYKLK